MVSNRRLFVALVAVPVLSALLVAPAVAQIFHVPGDFAALQDAIDGVPAGAVIVVAGGTHPPITIGKRLTIVGAPLATIDNTDASDPDNAFALLPAILLEGTGGGTVTLTNLATQGVADGSFYSASGEGIRGGGFQQLHVVDCNIAPAQWVSLTGTGQGQPAIRTSVPYVLVSRSTVTGGLSDTDDCNQPVAPDGAPAIGAVHSTVAVLASTVKGGRGPQMCFDLPFCPVGPCPCASIGAAGGPGIQAASVLRGGSSVEGGDGQPVFCAGSNIGSQPDGAPIVAGTVVNLTGGLSASGPMIMGTSWTLTWVTPGPTALLLVGAPTVAPVLVGSKGWLFLDASTMDLTGVGAGGTQVITTTLPSLASLTGVEVGLQLYDAAIGLTRPVIGVLRP